MTLKGRPLEIDPQMDFRISEWPINPVLSTKNLDIVFDCDDNPAVGPHIRVLFTSRIRIFHLCVHLTKLDNAYVKRRSET